MKISSEREKDNLRYWQEVNPVVYHSLQALPQDKCQISPSKTGLPTLNYRHQRTMLLLHSAVDPLSEGFKIASRVNADADHVVVLGLGLGYHLQALLETKKRETRVLVIEPDWEILKNSLQTLDWRLLLTRVDCFFYFGGQTQGLAETLQHFLDITNFSTLAVLELPAEVRLFAEYFSCCRQILDHEIKTMLVNFESLISENALVAGNILKNLYWLPWVRPASSLADRFHNVPAFIISAGPSLDKNVLQLKNVDNRALLISVDTALKPLLKKDIQPHFTVAVDPSFKNWLHLHGCDKKMRHFLLAEIGVCPEIFSRFHDRLFVASLEKPLTRAIEKRIGQLGDFSAWGSVASFAVYFAIYLGADPIIFLGQDFAYSDMRHHCRGTSWEENWLEYTQDLDALQRKEMQSIDSVDRVVETTDGHGQKTFSSTQMMLYKSELLKILAAFPQRTFVNASEGGILTEIPAMDLRDALTRYVHSRQPIDTSLLATIPQLKEERDFSTLPDFLKDKKCFFQNYAAKISSLAKKWPSAVKSTIPALLEIVNEAEDVQRMLYDDVQNGEIVEMWSQAPIYNFLRRLKPLRSSIGDEKSLRAVLDIFQDYLTALFPIINRLSAAFAKEEKRWKIKRAK